MSAASSHPPSRRHASRRTHVRAVALCAAVLLVAAQGCGGDDVGEAISNARTAITERTVPRTATLPPARTQTVAQTAPGRTVTQTLPAQTVTHATTVVQTSGDDDSSDGLLVVVVVIAAAVLMLGLIALLWRLARPETQAWKSALERARETAAWSGRELTDGLVAQPEVSARRERWQAAKPSVEQTVHTLRMLSAQARHRRNASDVLALADALTALAEALALHARTPGQDAVGLARQRADAVLAMLPDQPTR